MLTGRAFFADREDGHIWCDSCVPAEVVMIAGGKPRTGPGRGRYVIVESGELLVSHIAPRGKPRPSMRVRARCHVCGSVQPNGATT